MKLALVFDDLIQFGGAERLLLAIHEIWPDAPIYTSVVSKEWLRICAENKIKLKTSFIQKLPFASKLNRYLSPLMLHSLAFESFDFSDFDVVFSISARFAHTVITKPETIHICYMNSPGRQFWEEHSYFEGQPRLRKWLAVSLAHLRLADYSAAQRVDYYIANSKVPKRRIKKYYGRESIVIHPFVDNKQFDDVKGYSKGDYFLVICRLASWKKIDIAIRACDKTGFKLKIIGDGPDAKRLKSLAGSSVEFLGYIGDEEKKAVLACCTALIQTQYEDFGIASLEAMACGKPVLAFCKGGVLETVVPGKTGEFFTEQTSESLSEALGHFDADRYSPLECKIRALAFDKIVFQRKIKGIVENIYAK